jgi:hypothetical protein
MAEIVGANTDWLSGMERRDDGVGVVWCGRVRGGLMNVLKWTAWFVVVLLSVVALAILGLAIGGLVAMFAVLFLGLVAEGMWVWWRITHQPLTAPHP